VAISWLFIGCLLYFCLLLFFEMYSFHNGGGSENGGARRRLEVFPVAAYQIHNSPHLGNHDLTTRSCTSCNSTRRRERIAVLRLLPQQDGDIAKIGILCTVDFFQCVSGTFVPGSLLIITALPVFGLIPSRQQRASARRVENRFKQG